MQTIVCIFLLFCVLVAFEGCIIIPRYRRYEIAAADVLSIEIYDLRGVQERTGSVLQNETPIYTLEGEQIATFLGDLSEIQFSDHIVIVLAAIDPSFHYGEWVARINFTDGSYTCISNAGYNETYDANDQFLDSNHYSCDNEEWVQLILSYLPSDVN